MDRVLISRRGRAAARLGGAAFAAILVGCAGRTMELGSDGAGGGSGGSATPVEGATKRPPECEPSGDTWTSDRACSSSSDSPLKGRWQTVWPWSPDLNLYLIVTGLNEQDGPCGYVKLGDGPDESVSSDTSSGVASIPEETTEPYRSFYLFPGHQYPLNTSELFETLVTFEIPTNDPARGFCQVHSPSVAECQNARTKAGTCLFEGCICDDRCCDADASTFLYFTMDAEPKGDRWWGAAEDAQFWFERI